MSALHAEGRRHDMARARGSARRPSEASATKSRARPGARPARRAPARRAYAHGEHDGARSRASSFRSSSAAAAVLPSPAKSRRGRPPPFAFRLPPSSPAAYALPRPPAQERRAAHRYAQEMAVLRQVEGRTKTARRQQGARLSPLFERWRRAARQFARAV